MATESTDFSDSVISVLVSTEYTLSLFGFGVSLIGILANIFHLIVLTRKTMRSLTTNTFLIGISICDILRMFTPLITYFSLFYIYYESYAYGIDCVAPRSYNLMVVMSISMPLEILSRQLGAWYGVTVAMLRTLILRYPFNPRISSLTESKYGIRIFLLVTIIMLPTWFWNYFQVGIWESSPWTPSDYCGFPENYTQMEYFFGTGSLGTTGNLFGNKSGRVYMITQFVQGTICTLIPSILLPIATILLLLELRKAKKNAESLQSPQNQDGSIRSTRLVTVMTASFLIANTPLVLLYAAEYFAFDGSSVFWYITQKLKNILNFFGIINGIVHFFICFFMSSHYQSTARGLFWKEGRNQENNVATSQD